MNKKSILESLIFINQEPISVKKLAKILDSSEEEVSTLIEELINDLKENERGVRILKKDESVQMVTASENSEYVQKLIKSSLTEDLSPAALEVLAAIAYFGPLTRYEIENLRGVNSIFTLRNLLMRGLIERYENPKNRLSYVYKISFDFLKKMGIEKVEDLPNYDEFSKFRESIFSKKINNESSENELHSHNLLE